MLSMVNDFMPLSAPQVDLPEAFAPLIRLVENMPVAKDNGKPGLLAAYQLGPTVDLGNALPDLTGEIDELVTTDGKPGLIVVTAAFRDYAFLASAYLLEPLLGTRQ
jgi:indoleamine 2,3-dioxygenase